MVLGTGWLSGDEDALRMIRETRGCHPTRVEHALASPQMSAHAPSCSVPLARGEPSHDARHSQ